MLTETTIRYLTTLLLPPGINIVLLFLGYLSLRRWYKLGRFLVGISLLTLYLLSIPLVAEMLIYPLERGPHLNLNKISEQGAKAIVVLAGSSVYAPEYGGATAESVELARLRYAAHLHRKTKLPILVDGGVEADRMKRVLNESFIVPVKWQEKSSTNTMENAIYAKRILEQYNIKKFYLVTSAWHMPRSLWAFKQVGLDPIPAPTDYKMWPDKIENIGEWLPSASALEISSDALHEYIGLLWYRVRY